MNYPKDYQLWSESEGEPLEFYVAVRAGASRSELFHTDKPLYRVLALSGELEQVLRGKVSLGDDPVTYVWDNFPDATKHSLAGTSVGLYQWLKKNDLEDILHKDELPFTRDPLGYYHQLFPRVTRGQLQKLHPRLYRCLYKTGKLSELPMQEEEMKSWGIYLKKYNGLTQWELSIAIPTLIKRLDYEGMLERIPVGDTKELARKIRFRLWKRGYLK